MCHTDLQLVSGHNNDSGHKIAAGGPTHTGTLPWLGAIRRSRQQHSFWHAFHAARGAQLAFPSARNVPMPEKQPPAFRSVQPAARHHTAGGATRDRTRTPRTGGRGISQPTNPDERHGRTRASSAGLRPPWPAPALFLCPCSPERGALLWRTVSTVVEEWIPLIETQLEREQLLYESSSCNKLRTREEGANAAQQSAARGCPTRNVHSTAPNARNWSLGSCR